MKTVEDIALEASLAKTDMSLLKTDDKNKILKNIADALIKNSAYIIEQNALDLEAGEKAGLRKSLLDRLALNESRVKGMADGVLEIAALDDPIGAVSQTVRRPNGLQIGNMCVPLGVVAIIYEARPNVTSDAVALCLKTGNCVILRGGKEAINSNKAIVKVIAEAAEKAGMPKGAIGLVTDTSRESANKLMKLHKYIDLLIPRGGAALINSVIENSTVPTIQTGVGNCHIFVEKTADIEMAKSIVINAKTQRPSVCNAADTLLLDSGLKEEQQREIIDALINAGVEIHGDESVCKM
ncbi:MAG: glutamate-5-semialdehyde dehydrogenase [Clostridia bacterium]|nr:glutamate-5-semialdehyde dehydrogenase [Clostridia bacterium]